MKIASRKELWFLGVIYLLGLGLRLGLRLGYDPHLLTLNADVWDRLSIAQYFSDYGRLPEYSLRYLAYGKVPAWYPPLSPIFISLLGRIFSLDLPTVCSRIIPFFESLTALSFFFLVRELYNKQAALLATLILALTPSFIYWTGITTPQSLTLFLLPIYILLLLWRRQTTSTPLWQTWPRRMFWILLLSLLLAVNFLTHLTYFFALIILCLFAAGLKVEQRLARAGFLDLIYAIVLSQILTSWWWWPKHLYWWWVKGLVTSSSVCVSAVNQLIDYGLLAAGLGIFAVCFFLFIFIFRPQSKKPFLAPIFFWLTLVFLETKIEPILRLMNRLDLTWSPLVKPLEGFRFYCFLAQPLSLLTALIISEYDATFRLGKKVWQEALLGVLAAGLLLDIGFIYQLPQRWNRSGITLADYQAALWFRAHSQPSERIIADYYREQMFAGVCAGRALMGGLFPLRNVQLPYISTPAVVQDDIYTIYATSSAQEAHQLMKRYGATHIYYSQELISSGGFGSKFRTGFGVDIKKDKFKNQMYFEEVYRQGEREKEALIIKAKERQFFQPPQEDIYYPSEN